MEIQKKKVYQKVDVSLTLWRYFQENNEYSLIARRLSRAELINTRYQTTIFGWHLGSSHTLCTICSNGPPHRVKDMMSTEWSSNTWRLVLNRLRQEWLLWINKITRYQLLWHELTSRNRNKLLFCDTAREHFIYLFHTNWIFVHWSTKKNNEYNFYFKDYWYFCFLWGN